MEKCSVQFTYLNSGNKDNCFGWYGREKVKNHCCSGILEWTALSHSKQPPAVWYAHCENILRYSYLQGQTCVFGVRKTFGIWIL